MVADEEGFLHPAIDRSSCVECGLCKERCPYHLDIPTLLKRNLEDFNEHWARKAELNP